VLAQPRCVTHCAAASQAAGTIHGDFERGFICADVMRYEELKELGSEAAVKAAGKLRQEGKTYVVNDGCASHRGCPSCTPGSAQLLQPVTQQEA